MFELAEGVVMHFVRSWLILLLMVCGCSSSDQLYPVEGQVVVKEQPADGVLVTFHPRGADPITAVRPVGLTGADGSFTLTTGSKPGAAPGAYAVTFMWSREVKSGKGFFAGQPETRDAFGGAYASAPNSAFQVEIKPGPNKLAPFALK